jgi:phosphoribulokinase
MSHPNPIIAVTGSSGAGTSTVRLAFDHICRRESIAAIQIEGDSFHRFGRGDMQMAIAEQLGRNKRRISHFGPEGNLLGELERCFAAYAETGTCQRRHYIHNENEAVRHGVPVGSFTNWYPILPGSELLLYEGLHGGLVGSGVDVWRSGSTC